MPRQRTVRAAKTLMTASGLDDAGGNRPALDRTAVCQLPRPSSSQKYRAAEMETGTKTSSRKINTSFFKTNAGVRPARHIDRVFSHTRCQASRLKLRNRVQKILARDCSAAHSRNSDRLFWLQSGS